MRSYAYTDDYNTIYICVYIYRFMEEVDVRPKCARWKAFGTIVVVCVCGIPLQGVKIAFRARYVVYNTRQAVVKQHSSYVIAYDSQLGLVRKRIRGDFCAYL